MVSIPSRFARCNSDASASCIPRPAYRARIAAIPGRSVSSKEQVQKGGHRKRTDSFRIAWGYARKSHAASVITGQRSAAEPGCDEAARHMLRGVGRIPIAWPRSGRYPRAPARSRATESVKILRVRAEVPNGPLRRPNQSSLFGMIVRSSEPSSAASCSSTASRTRSDSRLPPRRAAALSRRRVSRETRTVMRWSFI